MTKSYMMMRLLTAILFTLLLASCAEKKTTGAGFKVTLGAAALSVSNAGGGLALWGVNKVTGYRFGRSMLPPYPASFQLDLENGNWDFYTIAWNGGASNNLPLAGTTSCGVLKNVAVLGVDLNLSLNLSQITCANGDFSPPSHVDPATGALSSLKFLTCHTLDGLTASSPSTACQVPGVLDIGKLTKHSSHPYGFKVSFPSFNGANILNPGIVSQCYPATTQTSRLSNLITAANNLKIPLGVAGLNNSPFFTIVHAFSDYQTCNPNITIPNGPPPMQQLKFRRGLNNLPIQEGEILVGNYNAGSTNVMFPMNQFFAGTSPFAGIYPYFNCYNSSSVDVNCVNKPMYNFIDSVPEGSSVSGSFSIYTNHILPNATTCSLGTFLNAGSISTSISMSGSGTNRKCDVAFNNATFTDREFSSGNPPSVNVTLGDGSTTVTFVAHLFVADSSNPNGAFRKSEKLKDSIFRVAQLNDGSNLSNQTRWDQPHQEQDGKELGLINDLRDMLSAAGPGGFLRKFGYATCGQMKLAANSNGASGITHSMNFFDFDSQANIPITLKLKPSAITKPTFMTGTQFDFRFEFWFGNQPDFIIETDCDNSAGQKAIGQYYYEGRHIDAGVEEDAKKYFVKAQTTEISDTEVEVEMISFWDKFETGLEHIREYDIFKMHYIPVDRKIKMWNVNSRKESKYVSTNQYNLSWRNFKGGGELKYGTGTMSFYEDSLESSGTNSTIVNNLNYPSDFLCQRYGTAIIGITGSFPSYTASSLALCQSTLNTQTTLFNAIPPEIKGSFTLRTVGQLDGSSSTFSTFISPNCNVTTLAMSQTLAFVAFDKNDSMTCTSDYWDDKFGVGNHALSTLSPSPKRDVTTNAVVNDVNDYLGYNRTNAATANRTRTGSYCYNIKDFNNSSTCGSESLTTNFDSGFSATSMSGFKYPSSSNNPIGFRIDRVGKYDQTCDGQSVPMLHLDHFCN